MTREKVIMGETKQRKEGSFEGCNFRKCASGESNLPAERVHAHLPQDMCGGTLQEREQRRIPAMSNMQTRVRSALRNPAAGQYALPRHPLLTPGVSGV